MTASGKSQNTKTKHFLKRLFLPGSFNWHRFCLFVVWLTIFCTSYILLVYKTKECTFFFLDQHVTEKYSHFILTMLFIQNNSVGWWWLFLDGYFMDHHWGGSLCFKIGRQEVTELIIEHRQGLWLIDFLWLPMVGNCWVSKIDLWKVNVSPRPGRVEGRGGGRYSGDRGRNVTYRGIYSW